MGIVFRGCTRLIFLLIILYSITNSSSRAPDPTSATHLADCCDLQQPDELNNRWNCSRYTVNRKEACACACACAIIICDWIWENPPYGIFSESWVWCMVDKLYYRANPRFSLRPIAFFVVEIQRFICDHATPPIIEKLRSKALLCTRIAFPHTTCDPEIN